MRRCSYPFIFILGLVLRTDAILEDNMLRRAFMYSFTNSGTYNDQSRDSEILQYVVSWYKLIGLSLRCRPVLNLGTYEVYKSPERYYDYAARVSHEIFVSSNSFPKKCKSPSSANDLYECVFLNLLKTNNKKNDGGQLRKIAERLGELRKCKVSLEKTGSSRYEETSWVIGSRTANTQDAKLGKKIDLLQNRFGLVDFSSYKAEKAGREYKTLKAVFMSIFFIKDMRSKLHLIQLMKDLKLYDEDKVKKVISFLVLLGLKERCKDDGEIVLKSISLYETGSVEDYIVFSIKQYQFFAEAVPDRICKPHLLAFRNMYECIYEAFGGQMFLAKLKHKSVAAEIVGVRAWDKMLQSLWQCAVKLKSTGENSFGKRQLVAMDNGIFLATSSALELEIAELGEYLTR